MTEWWDPEVHPEWLQLRLKYPWLATRGLPPYPEVPPTRMSRLFLWMTDLLIRLETR